MKKSGKYRKGGLKFSMDTIPIINKMSRCCEHSSEEAIPVTNETECKNTNLGRSQLHSVRQIPFHPLITFEMSEEELQKFLFNYDC
jgi:hypothetical protein